MEAKQRKKNGQILPEFVGDISGTYMTYLRSKASIRKLDFKVTKEDLWDLFLKQEKKCAISGVPLVISTTLKKSSKTGKSLDRTNHTASLDRIDNSKGYTVDNVQWVHKQVNLMRRQFELDNYINWCKTIAEYNSKH